MAGGRHNNIMEIKGADLGFNAILKGDADKLLNIINTAEYKYVILSLLFLSTSDALEELLAFINYCR